MFKESMEKILPPSKNYLARNQGAKLEKINLRDKSVPKTNIQVWFVNPPSPDGHVYIRDLNRSGRRSFERTIWPQTSLALCAAMLPEYECRIIDCIAERKNYEWLKGELKSKKPSWVIANAISSTLTNDMLTTYYAKAYGARTITVGSHVSALESETKLRFPCSDYTITGEPEQAIRNIITGETKSQPGFHELPAPRHDLLPIGRYRLPFIGKGYDFVFLSRGCPYKCIYCRQATTWKGIIQYRTPEQIEEEIIKYNLKNVIFHSDTATLNKDQMTELCRRIKRLNVRWCCNSRVNTVDPILLKLMKESGCWMIMYGIESGDNDILKKNLKGATVEQAEQAVKWTKEAGIRVWGYFMLGLYGDTKESMDKTISFAMRLSPDIANFSISCPYPGTAWFEIASKEGWLKSGDWEQFDQNYSAIVDQPNCSSKLVKNYVKKAYWAYYSNPFNLIRFLRCGG